MASLRQLHYFVTIAEEAQVTHAARRLGIAQPALSQAMARLEASLGVELLERHARGVTLTAAGEALLVRARVALLAAEDADLAVRAAAHPGSDVIEWGFIGSPPMIEAPELYRRFVAQNPEATVNFRELPFPSGSTGAWMADVDVVLCHSPTPDVGVGVTPLYSERRVIVVAAGHPLAARPHVTVEQVLDETFCGISPQLEPVRAGLWSLDDHRGGPPAHMTQDRVLNHREMAAIVLSGRAITAAPESNARNVARSVPGLAVIPLRGADPVVMSLAWRRERAGELVTSLVHAARELAA